MPFTEDRLHELRGGDWVLGHVARRREWAAGLVSLTLDQRAHGADAGQFVRLALDLQDTLTVRSYSLASAPDEPIEVYVSRVIDGALTPDLVDVAPGGAIAVDRHPAGHFTLDRVPDARTLWLVATGTGLGPYLSMLRTDAPWRRFERIVVVHGVRQVDQLGYRSEIIGTKVWRGADLVHVPVVSRDPGAEGVLHGRITEALLNGSLEEAAGRRLDPAESQVMLCGNPGMVGEMTALLGERGLVRNRPRSPGHVTAERYW